ncbi:hypothetical protein EK904_009446 [Melospiza melodia maxima]|nr:hypothetical protein EK904_009446 [Melospiza melodia maxima]
MLPQRLWQLDARLPGGSDSNRQKNKEGLIQVPLCPAVQPSSMASSSAMTSSQQPVLPATADVITTTLPASLLLSARLMVKPKSPQL